MEHINGTLQLFADCVTGENGAADAGQPTAGETPVRAEGSQDAAAENTRLSWEQIKADPEYNRQIQDLIRTRLKAAEKAWEKKYAGQKGEAAVPGTDGGVADPPVSSADRLLPAETAAPQMRQHYQGLVEQAEKFKQVFPGFDLHKALEDPMFLRLTAPNVGLAVEDAYYALHRKQLQGVAMQAAAQKTAEKLSNAIRAGANRPAENGMGGQGPAVASFNYASATPAQREALKNAIRRAGQRGEKLYPGSL